MLYNRIQLWNPAYKVTFIITCYTILVTFLLNCWVHRCCP